MVNGEATIDDRRRHVREIAIRIIDIITYAAVFSGGIFVLHFTPDSAEILLVNWPWVITLWSGLMITGGVLGFIGRITRIWAIEVPGTGAGIAGALIYAVVLGNAAIVNTTAFVAVTLVIIATLTLLRRYIELQIFTTEPGAKSLSERFVIAFKRRTVNAVERLR